MADRHHCWSTGVLHVPYQVSMIVDSSKTVCILLAIVPVHSTKVPSILAALHGSSVTVDLGSSKSGRAPAARSLHAARSQAVQRSITSRPTESAPKPISPTHGAHGPTVQWPCGHLGDCGLPPGSGRKTCHTGGWTLAVSFMLFKLKWVQSSDS